MKRFLTLYTIEQKLFFRNGDVFLFNLCMPAVVMLLIGMIGGSKMAGESNMTYLQSSYAAICSVGICCSAFMSIPIIIVDNRDKKILKRLYCSPCSPVRLLAADVVCSAVMAALSVVCVSIVAWGFLGYRMEGSILLFVGTWFVTLVSMFSIGLLAASICRTIKMLNVVTSILYFPMLFFSGATIPYELFPKGLQAVGNVMPLGVGIRMMKAASMGLALDTMARDFIILVAITVVCSTIAVKTFRWE